MWWFIFLISTCLIIEHHWIRKIEQWQVCLIIHMFSNIWEFTLQFQSPQSCSCHWWYAVIITMMWYLSWPWKSLYECLRLLSLSVFWSMQHVLIKYSKYDLLLLHVAGSIVKLLTNMQHLVKLNPTLTLTLASIWHIMSPIFCLAQSSQLSSLLPAPTLFK